ncbi:uncharacterized protein LOC8035007 [Ixodes scapularis]|uniref:uncharacterized protein LOC8035007 n=1 Tax=Ixodes scapularis TaxID=6945 RepID=UPI001A9F3188|nr:uncharacterized protein LOC8035007 [Ixodes scapularis]
MDGVPWASARAPVYKTLRLPSGKRVDVTKRNVFIRKWREKRIKDDPCLYITLFALMVVVTIIFISYHSNHVHRERTNEQKTRTEFEFTSSGPEDTDDDGNTTLTSFLESNAHGGDKVSQWLPTPAPSVLLRRGVRTTKNIVVTTLTDSRLYIAPIVKP